MSDEPLTNAAVDVLRAAVRYLSSLEAPPTASSGSTTSDHIFEDRRSHGVNFGTIDASGWATFIGSMWGVGTGHPHISVPEVFAVRGQRCAATILIIDYGNDVISDQAYCVRVTPDLTQMERAVVFDVDARDDAIALLDEWHAELGD